ncbi:MAG: LuxR C-terminal-related transcriptional regulator [Anaerolineae bacterium]
MNRELSHPTSNLLRTKLLVPPIPGRVIARPRLLDQLADGLACRLILVAAPAGFGKTTALGQWLAGSGIDTAWVSLDQRDNDPTRFWAYVVAALQTRRPDVGATALSMLQAPHPPLWETILTELLNDLVAIREDVVLVLDDYHVVENRDIHEGVVFAVENLPLPIHLAVASRAEPPFPLPLWRARRHLVELDADDLRFTPEEAAGFLNRVMDLSLSPDQVAGLESATEGWIAGLQLAALSMEGEEDLTAFIRSFSGSHRYVFDYLAQEVLERQPERIQRFLMETSILERLSGPLCDAVVASDAPGGEDPQAVLERLEATRLFVVPLDDERHWYRYHNLFAEFLQARLAQWAAPAEIGTLHRRAAAWHVAQGAVDAALHHTVAAEDFEVAADLLVRYAEDFFAHSTLVTLCAWIEALPDSLLESRPRLMMIYAWATLATGQLEKTERTLGHIEEAVGASTEALLRDPQALPAEQRLPLLEVAIVRTATGMVFFDLERVQRIAERLLPYLREEDTRCLHNTSGQLRPVLLLNLGLAHEFSGNLAAAVPAFAEALETGLAAANMHIVPLALGHLGQLQATQGRLHEAERTYHNALRQAEEMAPAPSPLAGNAYAGLGQLYYEWNQLERAKDYLRRGISLGKPWSSWESLVPGYMGLAQIHRVHRRWEAAAATLDELETVCRQANMEMLLPGVELARVQLQADRGDLEAAAAWAAHTDLSADCKPSPLEEAEALTRVRVLLALERYADAARLIERSLPAMEAGERWGRVVEARVLQALALEGRGAHDGALTTLERALALGEPEGYVRVFLDAGASMDRLLRGVQRERAGSPYVVRLLAAFKAEPPPQETLEAAEAGLPEEVSQPVIEPLTERELEVLEELSKGLTNPEIAERLMVSLNTVKTHTRNIYGKLGVRNRTEAVVRAQELGLLEA